jgi:hypothetical protein
MESKNAAATQSAVLIGGSNGLRSERSSSRRNDRIDSPALEWRRLTRHGPRYAGSRKRTLEHRSVLPETRRKKTTISQKIVIACTRRDAHTIDERLGHIRSISCTDGFSGLQTGAGTSRDIGLRCSQKGNDTLYGGDGIDTINGGTGDDYISGSASTAYSDKAGDWLPAS